MAALIAWMLVVRVDDLVKDGAKRRRLRRSSILDKIINANRSAVQAIKAAFWAISHVRARNAGRRHQPASLSMVSASLTSSSVKPPASWVDKVTSTFL